MAKTVTVDDKPHKIQIWDTAGQEKYRGLAPMYYRGAVGAILVFDITSQVTALFSLFLFSLSFSFLFLFSLSSFPFSLFFALALVLFFSLFRFSLFLSSHLILPPSRFQSSFEALKSWRLELETNGPDSLAIAIAGNKADLESKRAVSTEEAAAYAEKIGATFLETSALTGQNVRSLFEALCRKISEKGLDVPRASDANIVDYTKPPPNWIQKKENCGCSS